MPDISIIIPIYNTARFLRQCLDSILKQDLKNIEVILVNDGSTDNSLKICRKYEEKDSRIKVIDKINEGVEKARIDGYKIATGKYVIYIDSDDWLSNRKVLSTMYNKAEETGADYVQIQAYRTIDKYGIFKKQLLHPKGIGLLEQPELFDKYYISFFGKALLGSTLCGKLYRKSILDNVQIVPIGIKKGEDDAYNIQLFPYLKKIYVMEDIGYHYRVGGVTSRFIPNALPDAKSSYYLKMKMIEKFNYHKAVPVMNRNIFTIFKADIQQRVRYNHKKDDIIKYIRKEFIDPFYKEILNDYKKDENWNDPFINAMLAEDAEKIYLIGYQEEKKVKMKRKLIKLMFNLLK